MNFLRTLFRRDLCPSSAASNLAKHGASLRKEAELKKLQQVLAELRAGPVAVWEPWPMDRYNFAERP